MPRPEPMITKLVVLRRAAGLTQADVAATIGVHRRTVMRWESGADDIKLLYLRSYAQAVGANLVLIPPTIQTIETLRGDQGTLTTNGKRTGPRQLSTADLAG